MPTELNLAPGTVLGGIARDGFLRRPEEIPRTEPGDLLVIAGVPEVVAASIDRLAGRQGVLAGVDVALEVQHCDREHQHDEDHQGAGDGDGAFQRVAGRCVAEFVGDRGEQAGFGRDRLIAGVHQQKTTGAVGILDFSFLKTRLTKKSGLLISCNS